MSQEDIENKRDTDEDEDQKKRHTLRILAIKKQEVGKATGKYKYTPILYETESF